MALQPAYKPGVAVRTEDSPEGTCLLYGVFVVGVERLPSPGFSATDTAAPALVLPDPIPLFTIDAVGAEKVGLPAGRLATAIAAVLHLSADQEGSTRYAVSQGLEIPLSNL